MRTEPSGVATQESGGLPDTAQTLALILRRARHDLGCDAAGVLARQGRKHVEVAAFSEPAVREADQLQLDYREGPGLRSNHSDDVYVSGDVRADVRWPRWGPRVAALGWLSVLSAPLIAPQGGLGTLNLYSRRPDAFDAAHGDAARVFARSAATALGYAFEVAGLRKAIDARHHVGLAQGILMERYGVDADSAFEVLRRYSQDNNVKLRLVADHIVRTRRLPEPGQFRADPSSSPRTVSEPAAGSQRQIAPFPPQLDHTPSPTALSKLAG